MIVFKVSIVSVQVINKGENTTNMVFTLVSVFIFMRKSLDI